MTVAQTSLPEDRRFCEPTTSRSAHDYRVVPSTVSGGRTDERISVAAVRNETPW